MPFNSFNFSCSDILLDLSNLKKPIRLKAKFINISLILGLRSTKPSSPPSLSQNVYGPSIFTLFNSLTRISTNSSKLFF